MLNVSCPSTTLGNVSETVTVSVINNEISGYSSSRAFESFTLLYRAVNITNTAVNCSSVTLVGVGVGNTSGNYCAWNVTYETSPILINITSLFGDYAENISLSSGKVYFDVREVLGEFESTSNIFYFFTPSNNSFIVHGQISNDTNLYIFSNQSSANLNKNFENDIFYFNGNLFSNNQNNEIIN